MDFASALTKLWNKAPAKTRNAIIACHEEVFQEYNLNTNLEICHFMAQISHECMAGQIIRENMNYRAQRIMEVFGVGKHSAAVTVVEAQLLAGHPENLAERVYGLGNPKKAKELGNTRPGDGYRFRGGGMLQLTGGANYKKRGDAIGFDLYGNPEQLDNPTTSFRVAVAEFVGLGCLIPARNDNVLSVTIKVNGGKNGLADRTVWLRKWKEALDDVEAAPYAPRMAELDEAPKLLSTRTGQIGTVTGIAGGVASVAQVGQSMSTVVDTVQTVQDNAVQVVETVKVIRPFLGMMPHTWATISITASIVVVIGVIGILVYRHIKIKTEAA